VRPPGRDIKRDEEEQGVEGMKQSQWSRLTAVLLVMALALGAVGLAGCGGTVESPGGPSGTGETKEGKVVPEGVRGEILDNLKAIGMTFDATLVTLVYGDSETHIIARGPMKGPIPNASLNKAPAANFSRIDLDLRDGKWAVSSWQ
jgi:hypothetical protein